MAKDLNIKLKDSDIQRAHQLGKKKAHQLGKANRNRLVAFRKKATSRVTLLRRLLG